LLVYIDKLYQQTFDAFGKIDIIAASAGVCDKLKIDDITEEFFDKIVNVNYKGTFFTIQKAVKYLNNSASIILVSSTAAHRSVSGNSVYSSTKAAISRMVKNFAADLADRRIRVNAVSPGTIETPMLGSNRSDEFMAKIASHIPFKNIGDPDDIANYVLFLASDNNDFFFKSHTSRNSPSFKLSVSQSLDSTPIFLSITRASDTAPNNHNISQLSYEWLKEEYTTMRLFSQQ